jgi:hypothetical protein
MAADVFAQVPEFLAAFDNIEKNGFFDNVRLEIYGGEHIIYQCSLALCGYVPNDDKYQVDGCGSLIDPKAIIASCRKLVDQKKVDKVTTNVETKDWPLLDEDGECVVGSKGQQTQLKIMITFKTSQYPHNREEYSTCSPRSFK